MNEPLNIAHEELFLEIARYLEAVDVYRAERCEPTWLAESPRHATAEAPVLAERTEPAPSAH